MSGGGSKCLNQRVDEIDAMIDSDALFQAGAKITGGRRCAALKTCCQWSDCAEIHGRLWHRLAALIGDPK